MFTMCRPVCLGLQSFTSHCHDGAAVLSVAKHVARFICKVFHIQHPEPAGHLQVKTVNAKGKL